MVREINRFLKYKLSNSAFPSLLQDVDVFLPTDFPHLNFSPIKSIFLTKAEVISILPRSSRSPYDPYKISKHTLDHDSFFEISPFYGKGRITGPARVDGYPVGVMINNPFHQGGATDVTAGAKVMRLLQLCDTFHLPIVSLLANSSVHIKRTFYMAINIQSSIVN